WAGWLWALVPHLAKWPTEWVWETSLSALLVALAYWLTLLLADDTTEAARRARWLWFGVLWGVILLTNPVLATFLPFSLAWLWCREERRGLLRGVLLAGAVAFVMIAPWLVRNRVVMGHWLFLRDNCGFEFHLGHYHGS